MRRVLQTTVATIDGDVVGFTVIVDDEAEQVYVDRAARGSGIAGLLLTEVERQVAANGPGVSTTRRTDRRGRSPYRATATCGISELQGAGSQIGRARCGGLAEWSRRG